jgi:hypothetical protein
LGGELAILGVGNEHVVADRDSGDLSCAETTDALGR